MGPQRIGFRVEGKWLFLVVAWVLYAIIAVAALVTHQPTEIMKDVLYDGAGIMALVTYVVVMFA